MPFGAPFGVAGPPAPRDRIDRGAPGGGMVASSVLWVGTGLTMVDVIRSGSAEGRDGRGDGGGGGRRRPADQYGLPLSTTPEAAASYVDALDRILRVQSGAEEALAEALALDPGFALAHATLALLGHEWEAPVDVAGELAAARRAVIAAGDERERSFVAVVVELVQPSRRRAAGDQLLRHIDAHRRDALALSVAVPTIAFSGFTELPERTWELVEGLAPDYGDDWWYTGLLAFIRQEQDRFDEAASLAERALAAVPSSGHAVHARAHAHYETGDHVAGLAWLDPWVASCGRSASHRAHFSWHAALHELSLGDVAAVERRYREQLAPPAVTGVRALVDSGSLLWRCSLLADELADDWPGAAIDEVLATVPPEVLRRPATAFTAFHAVLALAAAGDAEGLRRLGHYARCHDDPAAREIVAPLADAHAALLDGRPGVAADGLVALRGRLGPVGGSAAQREVVEDTLLHALALAGRCTQACRLLDERLSRRASPRDSAHRARLAALATPVG
jgi:hypothetical protein